MIREKSRGVFLFRVRKQVGCIELEEQKADTVPTIAVLDTGITLHPDFAGRIVGYKDFINGRNSIYDDNGHGTHVCGIIAGSGSLSAGKYKGIAPFANLLVGKVLDEKGDGTVENMIKGIQWVLEKKEEFNVRVVNISVGIGQLKSIEKENLLIQWLEKAWREGLAVVCAAGNNGPELDSLSPLGKSPMVITVGCHDGEYYKNFPNRCENYSARGRKSLVERKPDIVAPGTEIISCDVRCRKTMRGYHNGYCKKSGTSMATAIVSGALGIIFMAHSEYSNEHAKKKLLYAATDLGEPWHKQGYGMLNIEKILR